MKYVIAVDQSTSATKVSLLDSRLLTVRCLRKKHSQYYPAPGWVEHDAEEIWVNTAQLLREVVAGIDTRDIAGIGIANQRETTVLWERQTGKPVCHAVVWQDVRGKFVTDELAGSADAVYRLTGLQPSPYYSAAKAAAVLRGDAALKARAERGELCVGTVDSYLLYRLTGGVSFAADISNAGRTQLFDITKLQWSGELAGAFGLPMSTLPERVLPSDSVFGAVAEIQELAGIQITAMMGDSNASLFGHGCTEEGMVKTSYGTGSSIMINTGEKPIWSRNGLSVSIGFAYGDKVNYVLEGNVTCSADTLTWLKDDLQLIGAMDELELASEVPDTGGVYLVPAFSGLGAPWFDENARAILCGMSRGTKKAHVVRAALESIAHQNADVLDAMRSDTGMDIVRLQADGGGSVNPLLMQMQSDLVPCEIVTCAEQELTLRGVGSMAGLRKGVFAPEAIRMPVAARYSPRLSESERRASRTGWSDALRRCR